MNKLSKKFMSILLAFVFILTSCGTKTDNKANKNTYKAGKYEAVAKGYAGDIKLAVTFAKDKIEKIEVLEHKETDGIGSNPVEMYPKQIVEKQSLAIDNVSGATLTSAAILKAVEDCVKQAGGNIEALKAKKADEGKKEAVKIDTEVLVIGGGGAGLSAAVAAAQDGAKVTLIEKESALGGNTVRAGGPYNAVDPERQKKVAPADEASMNKVMALTEKESKSPRHTELMQELKKDLEEYNKGSKDYLFDSKALHKLQTYDGGDYIGKLNFIEILVDKSLETLNWMGENGVKWSDAISTVAGGLWPRAHRSTDSAGIAYIRANETKAKELGVQILTNSPATELIVKDGKVAGAKGTSNGAPLEVNAKVVVIATGGFAANPEMRKKYNNALAETLPTTNTKAAQGDGIKMAEKVNANLIGMEYIQSLPYGTLKTGQLNNWIGGGGVEYYYNINKEGKRFMKEDGRRDEMTAALLAQPDQLTYVIADSDNLDFNEGTGKNVWGDDIEKLVSEGKIFKADTIEELAKQINIDPEVLKETHNKFNEYAKAGKDPDFGRTLFGKPLTKAPFYASPRVPTVHHTMGGLEISETTHVLDKNGKEIEGLLAAGEVTGGIHGSNRLGGNALVDIHVFGRIAGKEAAKLVKK